MQSYDPRTRPTEELTLVQLRERIGTELVSSWIRVSQEDVNKHADASRDWNYVHVDPAKALAENGLPGTIAHGFLTLSLLSAFSYEVAPRVKGTTLGLNYGLDRVRMMTPVPAGSNVRGRLTLAEIQDKGAAVILHWDCIVEIEGQAKPALAARWLNYAQIGA